MSDKISKADRLGAITKLRDMLKPGMTLHTVLRHVSRSGMQRLIDVYLLHEGEAQYLSGYVGKACGYRRHTDGGLVVGGCGMDMGFAIVYNLGRTLWPDGFLPTAAGMRGRNAEPADKMDPDGGYALRQEWL